MVTVGLFIRLQARPGKEADVANFLEGVMPLLRDEPATTALISFMTSRMQSCVSSSTALPTSTKGAAPGPGAR